MARTVVINRVANALNNIVNESVIAPGRAVAENLNRHAVRYQLREFMNRQIGTLTRSVDGEKSEANGSDVVEMRVCMTQKFARRFGRRVRRNRVENFIVLAERNFFVVAVDA